MAHLISSIPTSIVDPKHLSMELHLCSKCGVTAFSERNRCCGQSWGRQVQQQRPHLARVCDATTTFWCELKAAKT